MTNRAQKKGYAFLGLGVELLVLIIGALTLGQLLDEKYHWKGFGTVGMTLLALAGWFYHFWVLIKNLNVPSGDE